MNRLSVFAFSMVFFAACYAADGSASYADGGDTRPLREVFSSSDIVLHGAVIGSGIGSCGGRQGINSFYVIRVITTAKGGFGSRDIRACGSAPMLLASHYIIAGSKYSAEEIVFSPDAVLLVFPDGKYYRLISYDGPIVESDRGEAYAVGFLESELNKFLDSVVEGAVSKDE